MKFHNTSKVIALSLIAAIGIISPLQAGKIVTDQQGKGFGGWNLGNVDVNITDTAYISNGKFYNKADGSYDTTFGEGDSFESSIKDDQGVITGRLHGKDWPVGEPNGIKVLHNVAGVNNGKPENCIINTSYVNELDNPNDGYLDAVSPAVATPLDCAGPWQSHKRFKINFQPSTVIGGTGNEKSVDIVFNVENETGMRRYQVFQKLDNYSGKRLKGYAVQVGFGIGVNFVAATTQDINLSLGLLENDGADIWDELSIATFSHGLWGEPDQHFPNNGFFHDIPSGYKVTLSTDKKSFTSHDTLGSNYPTLFGNWLPSIWAPEGIFFDNDSNPETDAELMAFWSDWDGVQHTGIFTWRKGNDNGFTIVDNTTLFQWAMDPLYAVDVVEDTLNLGINFIVEVGDVANFTDSKFTIRYTPILDVNTTQVEPGWITNAPFLSYNGSMGVISINPSPSFVPGTPVTVRVADADLNLDATLIDTLELNVTNDQGEVELLTLNELDVNASVFEGILLTVDTTDTGSDNNGTLNVTEGTVVTATYYDNDSDGNGLPGVGIVSTTAARIPVVTPPDDDTTSLTTTAVNNDDAKGIFSTMDNTSLFAMILGFLAIGGLIARRKLVK